MEIKHKAFADIIGNYPTIYAIFIEVNGKWWVESKKYFDTKEEAETYIASQPDMELIKGENNADYSNQN